MEKQFYRTDAIYCLIPRFQLQDLRVKYLQERGRNEFYSFLGVISVTSSARREEKRKFIFFADLYKIVFPVIEYNNAMATLIEQTSGKLISLK